MFYVNAKLLKQFGRRVKANTVLFNEGENGQSMYVIHRGKVHISKLVNGKQTPLVVLGEGQFFGEMAILNNDARSATATSITECELLEIPKAGLNLLMQKSPEIAHQMVHAFSERLRETNRMINILFYQDDFSRVLLTLKKMAETKAQEGNKIIRVSPDVAVLAGQLNLTSSRVRRVIEDTVKAEILVQDEEGYKISNIKHLVYFLRFIHEQHQKKKAA